MDETGPAPYDAPRGRDRLRELLDAVLDEDHGTLGAMAGGAHASAYHFSRGLTREAGEPPVAMRRRVMLERAHWQLRHGSTVTEAAWAARYESVEGFARAFARAFGHAPSAVAGDGTPTGHWLPAPNGIHFHPPTSLWVEDGPATRDGAGRGDAVSALLVHHDLDDTRALLDAAKALPPEELTRRRLRGHVTLAWDGPEESVTDVLHHLVRSKEVWLASIDGADTPPPGPTDLTSLVARHERVAGRWLAAVRDVDRRGAWGDRLVDALCDPPESFVLASVVAHVLTFSAVRRGLARQLLREAGLDLPHGEADEADPITWLQRRTGGTA